MALYPSLEDMVVDQYQNAECLTSMQPSAPHSFFQQEPQNPHYGSTGAAPPPVYESIGGEKPSNFEYPSLVQDYRDIGSYPGERELTTSPTSSTSTSRGGAVVVAHNSIEEPFCDLGEEIAVEDDDSDEPEDALQPYEVFQNGTTMVAPITSQSSGLAKANVSHGVRTVVLCKDQNGKVGMRFRSVSKGIFVQFVAEGSPAALAGMRFGDQILQINKSEVVGLSQDKAMDLLTKSKNDACIEMAVRDRPFERAITLHKDSRGQLGFGYSDNEIVSIVKESSASRNGLLINHRILEVDGQNVIGLKTKEIREILEDAPKTVTLTIMPNELYNEMMKKISWSLIRKQDHSIPDF
ncbi:hypothetical protein QR680_005325 [Steinernema hermaphroditum]|uniref:PDZ domain-containing protein n=1 Tax=Steinernema hermaphroditum TaxID=289476 RepID=A0AA39LVG5_9BILA|nr:hypothetical protein QR680_005325 [Steinernema hermaphroditum]